MGSNGVQKTEKTKQKVEKTQIQETLHKRGLGLIKMGFWQVGWVGNNSWMDSAFVWRHLVPQNVGNIIFVIFSILGWVQQKVNGLGTSPRNQFRDHFIRNRLEKLVPATNITSPGT